jgi:cell wall-associated NlpC family hydrolase
MAINPIPAFSLEAALPLPEAPGKNSPVNSTFDTVLSSLRDSGASSSTPTGQQATVELFRIEMMLNSLSLSGDGAASRASGLSALEALVTAPAQYCRTGTAASAARPAHSYPVEAAAGQEQAGVPQDPASGSALADIGATASQYLGTPYRFGGEGARGDGIDCSSFVQKGFREHQIDLPRTAREQSKVGSEVAPSDLRKGDLVFFHTYASYPSHVGIYLGDGKMIHASSGKGEVTVSDVNSEYYRSRFLGAKRVA